MIFFFPNFGFALTLLASLRRHLTDGRKFKIKFPFLRYRSVRALCFGAPFEGFSRACFLGACVLVERADVSFLSLWMHFAELIPRAHPCRRPRLSSISRFFQWGVAIAFMCFASWSRSDVREGDTRLHEVWWMIDISQPQQRQRNQLEAGSATSTRRATMTVIEKSWARKPQPDTASFFPRC